MAFSIHKNGPSIILCFNYDFLSLAFYPSDPDCLRQDGYFSNKSGGEASFYICEDSKTITFYIYGKENASINVTLKITDEIIKSYYNTIDEYRRYKETI